MKREKKILLHFIAVTALLVFVALGAGSTTVPDATEDFSFPQIGIVNNAGIAAKDFRTVGVVFVNSVEVIDAKGNHTGSKITYEMFMREAVKLQADDVINVKVDVNLKREKDGSNFKTTYSYTGTGLAIKYTDAITGVISSGRQDISDTPTSASTPLFQSGSGQKKK